MSLQNEMTVPDISVGADMGQPSQSTLNEDTDDIIHQNEEIINNSDEDIDDFEIIPGVDEAIRKINASGYLCIVVTNQPVIARGEVTVPELEEIHRKMETLLGLEGAYVDGLYYCPHHPHKGYAGEVPELKIECSCRKPKPGMLLQAAKDYNIDLSRSWMVGDGENDVMAGRNAGCRTALIYDAEAEESVSGTTGGKETAYVSGKTGGIRAAEIPDYGQNITVKSLLAFAEQVPE